MNQNDATKQFLGNFNSPLPDEEESPDGWGGFGGYMRAKNSKLNQQFQSQYTRKSNIFNGVSIWVNGYTNPSSDELKRLMAEHGGRYQQFFSKTHVTHVIATNLPDSKIKALKKNDKVVRPEWIVDSVKAKKLIAIDNYLLYSVNKRDGNALTFDKCDRTLSNPHTNQFPMATKTLNVASSTESITSSTESMDVEEFSNVRSNEQVAKLRMPVLTRHDYKDTSNISNSNNNNNNNNNNKNPAKAGDDNFLSEYYSNSRLHHLSMWKAELKKFAVSMQQRNKDRQQQHVCAAGDKNRLVMHVDLDSFFVSVSMKLNPELKGKPVAVCHSGRYEKEGKSYENSFSQIASCSYEARDLGLHNGMMLHSAKQLCPHLICVPYEFEEYRNVSQTFYEILSSYTSHIEAVSCDEALMDITNLTTPDDVIDLAEKIRGDVWSRTNCKASCGISSNILIARLATKRAKPDGVCYISPPEIPQFIASQIVKDLPGVGFAHRTKFETHNITTCKDLQQWTVGSLQKEFGPKHGKILHDFCRGKDDRLLRLDHERKSVSAEINYAIRFQKNEEVEKFVNDLSEEVEKRLKEIHKKGTHITLKLMTRRKDVTGEPSKFLGHGLCDNLSRSVSLPTPTDDSNVISKSCMSLLRGLHIPACDLRGMGIQVTKLSDVSIATSTTKSLFHYTKVITPLDLHRRDKLVNVVIKPINDKQTTKSCASSAKTTHRHSGKIQSITSFLDSAPSKSNKFDKLSPVKLPPLPCISLDPDEPGPSTVARPNESNFNSWDPNVFKELPKDIQEELTGQMKLQRLSNLPSNFQRTAKSPVKVFSNKSPVKVFPKKRVRRIDQHSPPPKKAILTNHGSPCSSRQKTITMMTTPAVKKSPSKDVSNNNDARGFISPTQVNFDVLNELPAEIRNEVLTEFKKSQHYLTKKKSKCIVNTMSTPKDDIDHRKHCSTSESNITSSSTILSPSQLDQSVLRALPEEIRKEVLQDVKPTIRNRIEFDQRFDPGNNGGHENTFPRVELFSKQTELAKNVLGEKILHPIFRSSSLNSGNAGVTMTSISLHNTGDEPTHCKTTSSQVLPDLRGATCYGDVKSLIREWIEEFPDKPLDEDIDEICEYCHRLLTSYHMDTLFLIMKFVKRMVSQVPTWYEPYNRMCKYVQREMKDLYHGTLPLQCFVVPHAGDGI